MESVSTICAIVFMFVFSAFYAFWTFAIISRWSGEQLSRMSYDESSAHAFFVNIGSLLLSLLCTLIVAWGFGQGAICMICGFVLALLLSLIASGLLLIAGIFLISLVFKGISFCISKICST